MNHAIYRVAAILGGLIICFIFSVRWSAAFGSLAEWLAAIGTISAVLVALRQNRAADELRASSLYFERAEKTLVDAVETFLRDCDSQGRPRNDRKNWITFARGVDTARLLAREISVSEFKPLWSVAEQYWRSRINDVLKPEWQSYPSEYYGYTDESDLSKNFAWSPKDRAPLDSRSLAFIYKWANQHAYLSDEMWRDAKFSNQEIERMEHFGPFGLAEYLRIIERGPPLPSQ